MSDLKHANHFMLMIPFPTPGKDQEKLRFSDVFTGV